MIQTLGDLEQVIASLPENQVFEYALDPSASAWDSVTDVCNTTDYILYKKDDASVWIKGSTRSGPFVAAPESCEVLAKKKDRYCIYVLAPTLDDLEKAKENFAPYPWARPILIPTTFYLESVAYFHMLPLRRHEWEYADYVGTVGHTACKKLSSLDGVTDTLREASKITADVAAFMYRGDPLVPTAEKWHPGFASIWLPTLRFLGYPSDKIISNDIPSFYCNYWAATPRAMNAYMKFFTSFRIALETLPVVSTDIWKDSGYGGRGQLVARLPPLRCMEIWGVPWYPFHPFVCERIPCFFFWVSEAYKIVCAPL